MTRELLMCMPNFFAAFPVELPAQLLTALRESLPASLPCRWLVPEDFHLTVAFFGALQPVQLPAVIAALDGLPAPNFLGHVSKVLLLPSPLRCSALALGLEREAALIDYLKQCQGVLLQAAGVSLDPREPLPHITFARPARKDAPLRGDFWRLGLQAWASSLPLPPVSVPLQRLALYTAAEDRRVRRFQVVHARPPCER